VAWSRDECPPLTLFIVQQSIDVTGGGVDADRAALGATVNIVGNTITIHGSTTGGQNRVTVAGHQDTFVDAGQDTQ
jgi:hypothetical protein